MFVRSNSQRTLSLRVSSQKSKRNWITSPTPRDIPVALCSFMWTAFMKMLSIVDSLPISLILVTIWRIESHITDAGSYSWAHYSNKPSEGHKLSYQNIIINLMLNYITVSSINLLSPLIWINSYLSHLMYNDMCLSLKIKNYIITILYSWRKHILLNKLRIWWQK